MLQTKTLKSQTRVEDIATQIQELALRKGPDAKLPTTRELRDTYGTNLSTVNEALDQLETNNIIYRKDRSGIFVSPRINQQSILILLDSSFFRHPGASPFWGVLWGHLSEIAEARSRSLNEAHHFHLVNTNSSNMQGLPEDTLRWMERGRVDIVIGVGLSDAARYQIDDFGVGYVTFAGYGEPQIIVDSAHEWHLAIASLAEQGCRRIGFWMPSVTFRPYLPAAPGDLPSDAELFRREMELQNNEYHPELVQYGDSRLTPGEICLETAQQQGDKVAGEVFGGPRESWPDGIVIGDDLMTAGALRRLQVLGIKPGVDVKIASHANRESTVLYGYEDEITLVEYEPAKIARQLFETAGAIMAGKVREGNLVFIKPKLRTPLGVVC